MTEATQYATFDELVGARADSESGFPEEDFTITLNGEPRLVRYRSLSRAEALAARTIAAGEGGTAALELQILAWAMVRPALTVEQAEQWQKHALPLETEELGERINVLSGLSAPAEKKAGKDAYKEFESDPDAEFRALPGSETGDDGSSAATGDAES